MRVCKERNGERRILGDTRIETKSHIAQLSIQTVAQLRVKAQAQVFVAVQCCGGISTQRILLTPRWSSISVSMTVFFEPWHEAEANVNHLITKVSLWETWRQPNNWIIKSKECIMLLATLNILQKLNAIWSNWLLDYVICRRSYLWNGIFPFKERGRVGLFALTCRAKRQWDKYSVF